MFKRFLPFLAALVACVGLLACPVFASEIDEPAVYASGMHDDSVLYWTVGDDVRSIGAHWGVTYHDVPFYITWDDGIVLLIDKSDTSESFEPSIWLKADGWLQHTQEGELVTMGDNTFYRFELGKSSDYYGLDCSSLVTFHNSVDLTRTENVWFLERPSTDLELAVNFLDPSYWLIYEVNDVSQVEIFVVPQKVIQVVKILTVVGVGLLAGWAVVALVPKVVHRFLG